MGHVQISRLVPAPVHEVYRYVIDIGNLPGDLRHHLELDFPSTPPELHAHAEIEATLKKFGATVRVIVRIEEMKPDNRVTYRQVAGLFQHWRHTILVAAHDPETTLVTDLVDFHLPLGVLGALVDDLIVRREVERVLSDRLLLMQEHFASASVSASASTFEREPAQ